MAIVQPSPNNGLMARPGAWVDLGLTLPIFLVYHLAVVFLGVQNATDVVTGTLLRLSAGDRTKYLLATLAIGVIFAGSFALLGRGQAFRPRKFVQIMFEGVIYAFLMALTANMVVGSLFASAAGGIRDEGRFVGFIMSLGAGFYEELTFRVILFGIGAKFLVWLFGNEVVELAGTARTSASNFSLRSLFIMVGWGITCALIFSSVHYLGPLSDTFQLTSFTFRAVLGCILTLIFATRGFAAAVWTHAIYDVWVLVFHA
jgi:hypothetical protein